MASGGEADETEGKEPTEESSVNVLGRIAEEMQKSFTEENASALNEGNDCNIKLNLRC